MDRYGAPAKRGGPRGKKDRGVTGQVMAVLSDPENRSVLAAVGVFSAAVAFLASSWGEILIPE